ncbi:malto-oligosyltrehalose synthase [Nitriliruptor alkaliphilus]|uniref:malto-oligosyltrehalose synthase n=1 Tax=Nitriliruptor alkaliphilus TaxID=427918 RepID=UPI0006965059|nr:malto-oligosyltrehalose synthase [Nitriliruptor alkaliphilus]
MTVPSSTYRLQLHAAFDFRDAAAAVPYLADLGVSHLYLSPTLASAPGSRHGYDVVDPSRLDDELGGDEGFTHLSEAVHRAGMRLVLDLVPNHVGLLSPHNPWWWDVLRHGPDSRYAGHLDIRWQRRGDGPPQVLLPHLARPLDDELADGDALHLEHGEPPHGDDGHADARWRVVYHEHAWPVRPGSLAAVGLDGDDVAGTVATVEADRGRLLSLLLEQHHRPVHWRRANADLNYRRFFDITTLGGLRVEDPAVFADVHRRTLELVEDGLVDGLRIDHPDGLRDPAGYFEQLRAAAPDAWIVAEKILEPDERPRASWPIDGTVGYEFANLVLGLYIDPRSEAVLDDLYAQTVGHRVDYHQVVDDAKREVVTSLFAAELAGLHQQLIDLAEAAGSVTDPDLLRDALVETLVCLPVYRTYVRADEADLDDDDRAYVMGAVARARARRPDLDEPLDLICELLLLEQGGDGSADFVMRFQQLSGPIMAKGVEDTVFYRYLRFVAVNEVGGAPHHLGTSVAAFHSANQLRQRDWPATMLTTSTHDTKRSEDVRARLAVLSELPDLWVRAVQEWGELAARHRGDRGPAPEHELLLLQTLVGAWPLDAERAVAYVLKAAREGKHHSHWIDGDPRYEDDLEAATRGLLADTDARALITRLLQVVLPAGRLTSLSQTLLKLTSPGVPDIYQGTELWDLSLVDPDNRRPVDLAHRQRLLGDLGPDAPHPVDLLARASEGLPKLWLTATALRLRRERPDAFGPGATYTPLYAVGDRQDHLVAFVRGGEVLTVAPRLVAGLGGGFVDWDWGDTALAIPGGRWRCHLTGHVVDGGGQVLLRDLLAAFPVALLTRVEAS